jgi:hypothetical protein
LEQHTIVIQKCGIEDKIHFGKETKMKVEKNFMVNSEKCQAITKEKDFLGAQMKIYNPSQSYN